jgi:enoyl-CoA hydratase/carnithine racemase
MTAPVHFSLLSLRNQTQLGMITLQAPQSLNALSLEMIDPIMQQLLDWQDDPRIAAIWLQGEGEKAFCAGGDIIRLYQSMLANPTGPNQFALDFFSREYRLDYLLYSFRKPVICWGSGIVMGGGLGLLAGCSHRIVTETTRMAMPEISIGLFPDVGGTWFLNRMPGASGLFLGLTGASINATDAIYTGLADYFVPAAEKQPFLARLQQLALTDDTRENYIAITQALDGLTETGCYRALQPTAQVEPHMNLINALVQNDNLAATVAAITAFQSSDKWLDRGIQALRKGCAVSAHLVYAQLHRGKSLSLPEVFCMELNLAMNCCLRGDFQEGVRALLIDKDQAPHWKYPSVEAVPTDWIDSHFSFDWHGSDWPRSASGDTHPLADLLDQGKEVADSITQL